MFSPDSTRAIDPYQTFEITEKDGRIVGSGFDVDVGVALMDLQELKWSSILYCGTPCTYDEAAWLNDSLFVVVGSQLYYPGDAPLLPDTLVVVPVLQVFSLAESTVTVLLGAEVREAEALSRGLRNYAGRKIHRILADE